MQPFLLLTEGHHLLGLSLSGEKPEHNMPQGPTGHVPSSLEGIEGDNNVGYDETGALYSLQFGSGWLGRRCLL